MTEAVVCWLMGAILAGLSFEFKFTKADDNYYLIRDSDDDDEEYHVEIVSAQLHLTRIELQPHVHALFMKYWHKDKLYHVPYTKCEAGFALIVGKLYTNLLPSHTGASLCYTTEDYQPCYQQCLPAPSALSADHTIPRSENWTRW